MKEGSTAVNRQKWMFSEILAAKNSFSGQFRICEKRTKSSTQNDQPTPPTFIESMG
jgi:hypothetical protein